MDDDVMRGLGLLGPQDFSQNSMGGVLGPLANVTQNPVAAPGRNPGTPDEMPMSWADRLKNFAMPTPPGMSGLLSDEDVGRARNRGVMDFALSMLGNAHGQGGGNAPSLGQALQQGVQAGTQGFDAANEKTVQGNMMGMQLGQQQHVLQARQAIGKFLSQNMTGDQQNDFAALRKAYMMSAAVGDHEGMKALSPLLEKDPSFTPHPFQAIPAGGQTVLINPRTGQPVGTIPHTPTPMSDDAKSFREQQLQIERDRAAERGDTVAMHRIDVQMQQEAHLTDQYEKASKPMEDAAGAFHSIEALKDAALGGSGPAQQSLLMSYVKAQHPGLAVRPSEVHMYMQGTSVPARIQRAFANYTGGAVLSREQMNAILHDVGRLRSEWQGRAGTLRQQYQQRAKQYGINPILRDPFEGLGAPAAAPAGGNPLMEP